MKGSKWAINTLQISGSQPICYHVSSDRKVKIDVTLGIFIKRRYVVCWWKWLKGIRTYNNIHQF